ncbi:alpha/beta hydrolase [Sphingomonas ginsenosidivorax]|uniref:Alpha/beta hydrolase n=1 Tax=Sphingomonas ginsenosidivorax TaxID=862135 RepID=A0A5C6UIM6_9SPHN|nr:alpha/beta hydrolase [Sphingomonas ginsenosidivorax]TXC72224.1 alpha/beta hydrolase [Sphingomonas ginsenosidivorax]
MISQLFTSFAAISVALCASSAAEAAPAKNIVLVHGAYADGSGWKAVSDILTRDGYRVSIVQEPETSLEDDVAATRRILALQDGPTILVGHSYGGVVISDAGNDPKVQGLVYIAALMPDAGELLRTLSSRLPPATNNVVSIGDGFQILDPKTFAQDFAADLPADQAAYMAISQVPIAIKGFATPIAKAAWRSKPSWFAVATEDRKINPDLERFMAKRAGSKTVEIKGSHAVYASQPRAVAKLIEDAATHSGG